MSKIFMKPYLTPEGYQFVPKRWLEVLREVQLAYTTRTCYFNIVSCETCPFWRRVWPTLVWLLRHFQPHMLPCFIVFSDEMLRTCVYIKGSRPRLVLRKRECNASIWRDRVPHIRGFFLS